MDKDIEKLADQCAELNALIKKNSSRLNELKKELKERMELKNIKQIIGTNYKLRLVSYKNKFSSSLPKDFSDLGSEIIGDAIKSGLVAIAYKLDVKKYQSTLERNESTPIDHFVKKRKVNSALTIKEY